MEKIKSFIVDQFLFGEADSLDADTSFLEENIIDSLGIMELITFLEETYHVKINDDELTPENLDSLNQISRFISYKMKQSN